MTRFDDDVVLSPCISICRMDAAAGGLCVGCLRTIDEIVEWGTATSDRKHEILANVSARRDA